MGWLTAFLSFLSNVTGMWKSRSDSKNTPAMQKRADAQQDQKTRDDIAATTGKAMKGETELDRAAALARAREQDSE